MKSLISKLFPLTIALMTSLGIYAGDFDKSKNKFLSFPNFYTYNLDNSNARGGYNVEYNISHGLKLNLDENLIEIKETSLEWNPSKGEVTLNNRFGERISILDALNIEIKDFSDDELFEIFSEISTGKKLEEISLLEDIYLDFQNLTKAFNIFNKMATINQGKDFWNYNLNLILNANINFNSLSIQKYKTDKKDNYFEFTTGRNIKLSGNASANFEIYLNKTEDNFNLENYEGKMSILSGCNSTLRKYIEDFFQLKSYFFTVGLLQSKEYIERYSFNQSNYLKFEVDSKNFSMINFQEETELDSKEHIDLNLSYGIINFKNFTFMQGIQVKKINENVLEKRVFLDFIKDSEVNETLQKETNNINYKAFYGISFSEELICMDNLKFSIFGASTDYKRKDNYAGLSLNSAHFNFKFNSKKDIEAFLSFSNNDLNIFKDYFKKQISLNINPLKEYLETPLREELIGKLSGMFFTYSSKNEIEQSGIIISNKKKSIELGVINEPYEEGKYLNFQLPFFQLNLDFREKVNAHSYGRSFGLNIATNTNIGWVGLQLISKDKLIDSVGIQFTKKW